VLQVFDERNRDLIVNVDGHLSHRDRATVSPFDSAVQGGDAVWEGLRLTNGRIFALDEHLDRLRRSAHALGFASVPADEAITALAAALELTRNHIAERRQFGRPLAAFQAVAQQIADVYIASRTLHLATLSACWLLDTGRDAGVDLGVAGYWCAHEAPRSVRTCHHLHGGTGMDTSYPLHHFSALVSDLVRYLGGVDYQLERQACSST